MANCRAQVIRLRFLLLASLSVVGVNHAFAGDLEDLLRDALEGYVEQKAEQESIELSAEGEANNPAKNVILMFSGADVPEVDVFESLHDSSDSGTTTTTPPATNSVAENDCFNRVQNKIAWNYSNNKVWNATNIKNLCRGTSYGSAPPSCFYNAMFQGHLWGKRSSHTMNWGLATQLCAGVNNGNTPISCLKSKLTGNTLLKNAVNACAPKAKIPVLIGHFEPLIIKTLPIKLQEKECYSYVQGKIAWDAGGKNKTWAANNVKRLCKGTTSKYSPGNCFSYAMHKGSTWGKKPGQIMNWSKAIDLCEGASNANKTTSCFKNAIASGSQLDSAIAKCDK